MTLATNREQHDSLASIAAIIAAAESKLQPACLYVVASPIGNIADISLRALAVLGACDHIACEDTRTASLLLSQYGLHKSLVSWHAHNEHEKIKWLLDNLAAAKKIALVSDAGMPLISDPGAVAVQAALEAGFKVEVIPGANAALTALCGGGLPLRTFAFFGFLPKKGSLRKSYLQRCVNGEDTTVIYESPVRIKKLLEDLSAAGLRDRQIVIARELTKRYEEFLRGDIQEVLADLETRTLKGECVLLVAAKANAEQLTKQRYGDNGQVTCAGDEFAVNEGETPANIHFKDIDSLAAYVRQHQLFKGDFYEMVAACKRDMAPLLSELQSAAVEYESLLTAMSANYLQELGSKENAANLQRKFPFYTQRKLYKMVIIFQELWQTYA